MDSYNEEQFNSAVEQELTFPEQELNFLGEQEVNPPDEQELSFANEQPQLDEEGENLDKVLLDMFNSSPRTAEPILNMPDTSFDIDEFLIELMSIADPPPPSQEIDFNITEKVEEDLIDMVMLTNTDEEMLRQSRNQLTKIQEELMNDNDDDIEMASLVEEDGRKFNCQYCRKKFYRKQHKTFHEKNCEQKPGTSSSSSSSKRMRQTRMDEFANNNNMSMTEDATQVGGANLYHQHPETWCMPLIQSTFNKSAATHQKTFDEKNTENLMERLWNVLNIFKDTISMEKRMKKAIKYFFSTKFIFHKNKNTDVLTDPPITFNTKVVTLTDNNKDEVERQLKLIYDQIVDFIEEFIRNGSDWVLDHFIHLDLGKKSNLFSLIIIILSFLLL